MAEKAPLTPLMQQYMVIRQQYPDTILLFQVGDFYELFFEDAKKASAFLGIALTKRGSIGGEPIPLCGVPVHALQHYLIKLVRGGFKVAICQQLEEPVPGKVVERGVTQVLTPGTLTDMQLLDEKSASYLCSFFPMQDSWGLLFSELMTAQLFATVLPAGEHKRLESEVSRYLPDEIVLPHGAAGKEFASFFKKLGYFTSLEHIDDSIDQKREVDSWIKKQFHEKTDRILTQQYALKSALHTFYLYMRKNNKQALEQFNAISWYEPDDFLVLDSATQRNLELVVNRQDGTKKGTLFAVLDKAITPMGSRMIKKWITRPLVKQEHIVMRQQVITVFMKQLELVQQLEKELKELGDLERVVGRIALKRAQLQDYMALKSALGCVPEIARLLKQHDTDFLLQVILAHLIDFASLHQLLEASLNDAIDKPWLIRSGFDQQLDHLRELVENSNNALLKLEQEEQERTGINSLKIRFNNIQGYSFEVTKPNMHLVPSDYVRLQTLVNRERYTNARLQQLQSEINQAQQEIGAVEKEIFERIKHEVDLKLYPLRKLAHGLAHLDALYGLAQAARDYRWIQPTFNDHRSIHVVGGRHPVVEAICSDPFIANDTELDDATSLWIITGPNMGGKSTYLRQVALNSILAQIGSFVPADKADLSILDRIFTRIGSGDYLVEGKSTFLVEMEETATICTQATDRSLVILDEVGRGTSTFDGLAIAQAVIEYIYTKIGARCLFATHYHELTQLESKFPGIVSYHAASKKTAHGITFLYKMQRGVADGSFGVQVAKLAQLPHEIILRAQELLQQLDQHEQQFMHVTMPGLMSDKSPIMLEKQYAELKEAYGALQQQMHQRAALTADAIDFDNLSPKKAFDLLWELKERQS